MVRARAAVLVLAPIAPAGAALMALEQSPERAHPFGGPGRRGGMRPLLLILCLGGLAGTAAAEPRRHDGFYFRAGAGPAFPIATFTPDTGGDSDASGPGVGTELAVGTTIRPRLVIGGGTFPMVSPAPSYDDADPGGQHVSATGPFVAYWLDARGGLQVQGGLLFAAGYLDGSDTRPSQVGVGYGAMAGVGYDRFISDQWSVGALARLSAYRLYGVDDTIRIATPALLVTFTYH